MNRKLKYLFLKVFMSLIKNQISNIKRKALSNSHSKNVRPNLQRKRSW